MWGTSQCEVNILAHTHTYIYISICWYSLNHLYWSNPKSLESRRWQCWHPKCSFRGTVWGASFAVQGLRFRVSGISAFGSRDLGSGFGY